MSKQELIKLIENLNNPQDYCNGLSHNNLFVPKNLVLFRRTDFKELSNDKPFFLNHRYILILNFGDPQQIIFDGKTETIQNDSIFLLFPYQLHRFVKNDKNFLNLLFITFEIEKSSFLYNVKNVSYKFTNETLMILERILYLYHNENNLELGYNLGALLSNFLSHNLVITLKEQTTTGEGDIVNKVCILIHQNSIYSIKEIAKNLNMSESNLSKIFKRSMGITLGQYIIEIRLTEVIKYLKTTEKTISEIAQLTGYSSVFALSRSFTNYFSISPTSFRKAQKNDVFVKKGKNCY